MNGTISSIHARKIDGALNIPIVKDLLAIRLAGVVDDNQGNRVFTVKQASDPAHNPDPLRYTEALRASARFEPADWMSANLMYQTLTSRTRNYRQVLSAAFVTGAAPVEPVIRARDRRSIDDQGSADFQSQKILSGSLDLRFGGQKLSYVGSYSKQDFAVAAQQDFGDYFSSPRFATTERIFADRPGGEAVCSEQGRRARLVPTTANYYQCSHGVAKRNSHEVRLLSDQRLGGIFDYVIGVFYDRNVSLSRLTSETPILANLARLAIVNLTSITRDAESTEKSAFGNVTAHLDALEISGGLRYIDYKNSASLLQDGARPIPDTRDHENATIYNASAKYEFSRDLMVYASTGSSWRVGPRAVGNFSTTRTMRESSFMDLPAERSKSYEVGVKTTFMDGRGRFNLSAFHQDFKNYPYRGSSIYFINRTAGSAVDTVGAFNFLAAVPVKVDGVEADASFRVAKAWSVSANASYANGRIKNGTIACNDLNGNGVPDINAAAPSATQLQASVGAGDHVAQCGNVNQAAAFTPRFGANLQSEYEFSLTGDVNGFARGLITIVGKSSNDPTTNFDDTGAYSRANVFAGFRDADGAWEVTPFAKNIFNERKILPSGNSAAGSTPAGTPISNALRVGAGTATYVNSYYEIGYTPPREFGVALSMRLGSR